MSFDVDSVDKEHVTISTETLDKHGFESAAEMIETVMNTVEKDDETVGKRRFDRGYQGGEK